MNNKEKCIGDMANVYYDAMLKARGTLGSMNEGAPKWYAKHFYEEGYRKQEWISVEDSLPEDYEKYLLLLDNGRITIGWYHEGAMQFVEDGIVIINIVTHWMPLPQPPETKGETE